MMHITIIEKRRPNIWEPDGWRGQFWGTFQRVGQGSLQ